MRGHEAHQRTRGRGKWKSGMLGEMLAVCRGTRVERRVKEVEGKTGVADLRADARAKGGSQ